MERTRAGRVSCQYGRAGPPASLSLAVSLRRTRTVKCQPARKQQTVGSSAHGALIEGARSRTGFGSVACRRNVASASETFSVTLQSDTPGRGCTVISKVRKIRSPIRLSAVIQIPSPSCLTSGGWRSGGFVISISRASGTIGSPLAVSGSGLSESEILQANEITALEAAISLLFHAEHHRRGAIELGR